MREVVYDIVEALRSGCDVQDSESVDDAGNHFREEVLEKQTIVPNL